MRYAPLADVVAGLTVILAEQLFPGTVGGGGDGGLSHAPFDLRCVKMKKSDNQSPLNCSATLWAFPLFVILLPVAKALVLVLLPCKLLFGFGFLCFKLSVRGLADTFK